MEEGKKVDSWAEVLKNPHNLVYALERINANKGRQIDCIGAYRHEYPLSHESWNTFCWYFNEMILLPDEIYGIKGDIIDSAGLAAFKGELSNAKIEFTKKYFYPKDNSEDVLTGDIEYTGIRLDKAELFPDNREISVKGIIEKERNFEKIWPYFGVWKSKHNGRIRSGFFLLEKAEFENLNKINMGNEFQELKEGLEEKIVQQMVKK
jgi:hypothetical protein